MTPSIACCCHFYNDREALYGLLETASAYFDNLFFVNSGPGGAYSTDGSIELVEQFGATLLFDDIQKGFGVIRTRLIHECGCSYAAILDADERFHPEMPVLNCIGNERYPTVANPNLEVIRTGDTLTQGAKLKRLIADPQWNAIRATRRHWFDFTFKRPCQNWLIERDHQLRIVRNIPEIQYRTNVVMHEQLIDVRTMTDPSYAEQDDYGGIMIDHYHLHYRRTQPGKKEWNEANYSRLETGEKMIPAP